MFVEVNNTGEPAYQSSLIITHHKALIFDSIKYEVWNRLLFLFIIFNNVIAIRPHNFHHFCYLHIFFYNHIIIVTITEGRVTSSFWITNVFFLGRVAPTSVPGPQNLWLCVVLATLSLTPQADYTSPSLNQENLLTPDSLISLSKLTHPQSSWRTRTHSISEWRWSNEQKYPSLGMCIFMLALNVRCCATVLDCSKAASTLGYKARNLYRIIQADTMLSEREMRSRWKTYQIAWQQYMIGNRIEVIKQH